MPRQPEHPRKAHIPPWFARQDWLGTHDPLDARYQLAEGLVLHQDATRASVDGWQVGTQRLTMDHGRRRNLKGRTTRRRDRRHLRPRASTARTAHRIRHPTGSQRRRRPRHGHHDGAPARRTRHFPARRFTVIGGGDVESACAAWLARGFPDQATRQLSGAISQ
ncbi:DUF7782 domain-containing protein [Nocardia acidivorans]|uniref:DUF7782 domain-containing protein n=1 Tax=Nocardia acidivorans TaxID=404580 RepID=UPI00403985CE